MFFFLLYILQYIHWSRLQKCSKVVATLLKEQKESGQSLKEPGRSLSALFIISNQRLFLPRPMFAQYFCFHLYVLHETQNIKNGHTALENESSLSSADSFPMPATGQVLPWSAIALSVSMEILVSTKIGFSSWLISDNIFNSKVSHSFDAPSIHASYSSGVLLIKSCQSVKSRVYVRQGKSSLLNSGNSLS